MSEPIEKELIRQVVNLRKLVDEVSGYGTKFSEHWKLAELQGTAANIEIILGSMGITQEKYLNDQLPVSDVPTA